MNSSSSESNSHVSPQQEPVEVSQASGRDSGTRRWELAGWMVIAFNLLLLILYVIPFYHRWYRVPVNLLGTLFFFASIATVALMLVAYLFKRRFSRAVMILVIGIAFFFATTHYYDWRTGLTERIIQAHYCRENRPVEEELVLGGIINTGRMFINDSHCLIVVCDEEFYYCDRPAERQSEQHR